MMLRETGGWRPERCVDGFTSGVLVGRFLFWPSCLLVGLLVLFWLLLGGWQAAGGGEGEPRSLVDGGPSLRGRGGVSVLGAWVVPQRAQGVLCPGGTRGLVEVEGFG